jgi:hypothetical protein
VKTDLLAATIKRRRALDDVAIFDPLDTTGRQGTIAWSPTAAMRHRRRCTVDGDDACRCGTD